MTQELIDRLQAGLKTLNVAVDPGPFIAYAELLYKWNKAYNLTAIRDLPSILAKHIFDSLAISPWLVGKRLIDVGTGAGLPGIPLAIANPNLEIYLLDSNGKKIQFLLEVKRLLSLTNIAIINSRVESYHPSECFDMVTSRAFSDIGQMLRWTEHLLSAEGIWLAMKGRYPEAELTTITKPYKVFSYSVPEIEGERCCVVINKNEQKQP